jgi:hypothetical protein
MTVGVHRGLTRSSFVRAMVFQFANKFLLGSRWFLGSLEFITDTSGDLSLQELESSKVTRLGTGRPHYTRFELIS